MPPTLTVGAHVGDSQESADNPDVTAPVTITTAGGEATCPEDCSSSPGSFSSSSSDCGQAAMYPAMTYPPYPTAYTSYIPTSQIPPSSVTYIQQPLYFANGFTDNVVYSGYPAEGPYAGNPAQYARQFYPAQPCVATEVTSYPIPCTERTPHSEATAPLHVTIPPANTDVATTPVQTSPHRSVTTNMEVVWHSEFERLFRTFSEKHRWVLIPCLQAPDDRCHEFRDSAKVRFCCQKCGNGWTSMKGRVMFWFYLDNVTNMGFVYFRLYGQKCTKCESDEFAHALWYPAEVIKVVGNIYLFVGQTYYSMQAPQISTARRSGKPRTQHNSKLCQACTEGICREAAI